MVTFTTTVQGLVAVVQSHDARMDSLIKNIGRYITARGSNGAGGDGQAQATVYINM